MERNGWVARLAGEWRDRSANYRADGAASLAAVYDRVAGELEAAAAAYAAEPLSLPQAAAESGYAPDQLRRLRKAGKWDGTRGGLPRRPRRPRPPVLHIEGGHRRSLVDDVLERRAERGA